MLTSSPHFPQKAVKTPVLTCSFKRALEKKWNLKKQPLTECFEVLHFTEAGAKAVCYPVCAFVPYLADFGWCKNHVEDARPASNHSCGDCIGQCYHQEPQIAERDIKHVNHKKKNKLYYTIYHPASRQKFQHICRIYQCNLGKKIWDQKCLQYVLINERYSISLNATI